MTHEQEDIVERLRAKQRRCKGNAHQTTWTLCADAISEITRLRRFVDGTIAKTAERRSQAERGRDGFASPRDERKSKQED